MANRTAAKDRFLGKHSLGIASIGILILWSALYSIANPGTHIGSLFGNAIAVWSGVAVTVFATKHLYEKRLSRKSPPSKGLGQIRAGAFTRAFS